MDDGRFDALTRALHAGRSRRAVLGLIAMLPALAAVDYGEARGRSHRRKHCPKGQRRCKGDQRGRVCVDLQTDPRNCGVCGQRCERGTPCVEGFCTEIDPAPEAFTCPVGTQMCSLPPSYHAAPTCCAGFGFCATCIPGDNCVCCPPDGGDCQFCENNTFACCSKTNCVCCQDSQRCDETSATCVNIG